LHCLITDPQEAIMLLERCILPLLCGLKAGIVFHKIFPFLRVQRLFTFISVYLI
jgi:hypothetical protein